MNRQLVSPGRCRRGSESLNSGFMAARTVPGHSMRDRASIANFPRGQTHLARRTCQLPVHARPSTTGNCPWRAWDSGGQGASNPLRMSNLFSLCPSDRAIGRKTGGALKQTDSSCVLSGASESLDETGDSLLADIVEHLGRSSKAGTSPNGGIVDISPSIGQMSMISNANTVVNAKESLYGLDNPDSLQGLL